MNLFFVQPQFREDRGIRIFKFWILITSACYYVKSFLSVRYGIEKRESKYSPFRSLLDMGLRLIRLRSIFYFPSSSFRNFSYSALFIRSFSSEGSFISTVTSQPFP
jgi:hypothetical protein